MRRLFHASCAAIVAGAWLTCTGTGMLADEPSAVGSNVEEFLIALQPDDDRPPPPGARGRGPGDRGPRDHGPGDRGPGDRGSDDRRPRDGGPEFRPPGGPMPGARRGGPGSDPLDASIARLEQKLDIALREIRSLRSDRPPLAMARRVPDGPPAPGMRGGGPRPPMGSPAYARRGGDGDRGGPPPRFDGGPPPRFEGPPRDGDGPRPRWIGPPEGGPPSGVRRSAPPRDENRPGPRGGARSGGPPRDDDRGPPRAGDRRQRVRDADLTF